MKNIYINLPIDEKQMNEKIHAIHTLIIRKLD